MLGQTPPVAICSDVDSKNSIEHDMPDVNPKCLFSLTDNVGSPEKNEFDCF